VYFFHDHTLDPGSLETLPTIPSSKLEIKKGPKEPIFANILFRYNTLTSYGQYEATLDSVVAMAKSDLKIRIRISGHADSRGTEEHNMELSEKRANEISVLIISKGISKNRIITEAYGESLPLNHCIDDVDCTEEEYAINSRVEIRLVR
jgi:outer membrane protein OmpA-like peptidoglycan-associated protein